MLDIRRNPLEIVRLSVVYDTLVVSAETSRGLQNFPIECQLFGRTRLRRKGLIVRSEIHHGGGRSDEASDTTKLQA